MVEVGLEHDGVVKIKTLFGKIDGQPGCGAAENSLDLGSKSHVSSQLIIERVEESFHSQIKSALAAKREPLVEGIVLNELLLYSIRQGKYEPVELLEVFHIGNHYQEAQD